MDLYIERTIEKPYEPLAAALMAGPSTWLPGQRPDGGATVELDVRLGASRVARRVVVRTGEVSSVPGHARCLLPVAWQAADHPERYPKLVGRLELVESGPRRTMLALRAVYHPPAGLVGEAADHAAMHLVAEASVRAFLTRVAGILERKAMSRLLAVAEPFPHGE